MAEQATAPTRDRTWMNVRQAAEYAGVDPVTIWRARRRGELRAGGAGTAVRIHRADLDSWLRAGGDSER